MGGLLVWSFTVADDDDVNIGEFAVKVVDMAQDTSRVLMWGKAHVSVSDMRYRQWVNDYPFHFTPSAASLTAAANRRNAASQAARAASGESAAPP